MMSIQCSTKMMKSLCLLIASGIALSGCVAAPLAQLTVSQISGPSASCAAAGGSAGCDMRPVAALLQGMGMGASGQNTVDAYGNSAGGVQGAPGPAAPAGASR